VTTFRHGADSGRGERTDGHGETVRRRPRLAVWKFSSCDGCQLTLLACEEELLTLADRLEVAYFLEASSAVVEGPYDISLVEGSITTPEEAERIERIRRESGFLIAIGACATAGGIQSLRNYADVDAYARAVYAHPDYLDVLPTATPLSEHVKVDLELRGCPIAKEQLLEAVGALLHGRRPSLPTVSVCQECKRRGTPCVMVGRGVPCLGPVTQAGCGALCPAVGRGCYGCFGPAESANVPSLMRWWRDELGVDPRATMRALRTFNAAAPAFGRAEAFTGADTRPGSSGRGEHEL
jgi:sulfhydrogenase subunit delta